MKLVHLVGFITKKFVAMHGHMNVRQESVPAVAWFVINECKLGILVTFVVH